MFSWYRRLIREWDWFVQKYVYKREDLVQFDRNKYDLYKNNRLKKPDVSSKTEPQTPEKGLPEKLSQ